MAYCRFPKTQSRAFSLFQGFVPWLRFPATQSRRFPYSRDTLSMHASCLVGGSTQLLVIVSRGSSVHCGVGALVPARGSVYLVCVFRGSSLGYSTGAFMPYRGTSPNCFPRLFT